MRSPSRERRSDKVDVHWMTEVVSGASLAVAPGTASTGHLSCVVQGTSKWFCTSTNESAVLVRPRPWQAVGFPEAVRNRRLTFPFPSRCMSPSIRTRPWQIKDSKSLVPLPFKTGTWPFPDPWEPCSSRDICTCNWNHFPWFGEIFGQ